MGVVAIAAKHLIAAGVTGDALVTALEDIEAAAGPPARPISAGAERTRRWREKKEATEEERHKASQNVTCDVLPIYIDPTSKDPIVKEGGCGGKPTSRVTRARPKVPLPADWHPMEELTPDERAELVRFKDYARAHDRRYSDWFAAWRNWKTSPYRKPQNGNLVTFTPRRGSREDLRERMANAIDRLDSFAEFQSGPDGSDDGGQTGPPAIGGIPKLGSA